MGKDINSLIKELIEEEFTDIEYPPAEEIWEGVWSKIKSNKRKLFFIKSRAMIVSCASLIILFSLFASFQSPVMALAHKILKGVEEFTQDTLKIHIQSKHTTQIETPKNSILDDPRILEAQKKVNFTIISPNYIPKGFKLISVDVSNKNEEKEVVSLLYLYKQNATKSQCFEISQKSFPKYTEDDTINVKTNQTTKVEHITINQTNATLVRYEKSLNKLIWIDQQILYKIDGNLSKEEIIKIAKSVK